MIIKPHFPSMYGLLDSLRQKWGTFRLSPAPGLHSHSWLWLEENTHLGCLDSLESHHLHSQLSPGWRAATLSSLPRQAVTPSLPLPSLPLPAPSSLLMTCTFYFTKKLQTGRLALPPDSASPHFPAPEPAHWPSLLCPCQGPLSSCRVAQPRSFLQKSPSPVSHIINFPLYWIFPISIQMSYYFSYKNKNSNQNLFWPHFPSSYLFISCRSNSSKADAAEQPLVLHSLNLPSHQATPILLSRSPMTSTLLNPMTHFLNLI